jgi:hypothetical protein
MMHSNLPVAAAIALAASGASAAPTCGREFVLDLSGLPALPLGGQVIAVAVDEGTIEHARLDVTFTATGTFDAGALSIAFFVPVGDTGGSIVLNGAAHGWSGPGTFAATVGSDAMNGVLAAPKEQGYYTWLFAMSAAPGATPMTGAFDDLRLTLTFAACVPGDLDGDIDVDFEDLLALLAEWGPCAAPPAPCPADIDGSGDVGFADLIQLLANWGDQR